GAVPFRGDDARRRLRRAAPGLPQLFAGGCAGRHRVPGRVAARGRALADRPRHPPNDRGADPAARQREQYRGARPRALHPLHLLFPSRRGGAPRRHDRRHRAHLAPQAQRQAPEHRRAERAHETERDRDSSRAAGGGDLMMIIGLGHYLTVAAILFTVGVFGIFLSRTNVIIILMSIELILLAVNINLVAFSTHLGDLVGQVFALIVLTVAAAEAAIGLAILVVYFRNRGSIAVEDVNLMKG